MVEDGGAQRLEIGGQHQRGIRLLHVVQDGRVVKQYSGQGTGTAAVGTATVEHRPRWCPHTAQLRPFRPESALRPLSLLPARVEEPRRQRAAIGGGEHLVLNAGGRLLQAPQETRRLFGRREIAGLGQQVEQRLVQRARGVQHRGEGGGAVLAHQRVRVLATHQAGQADGVLRCQGGQGSQRRPGSRAGTGGIAVEAQDGRGRQAPELGELLGRQRRAERCHGGRKARLLQGDHVHVAFHDHHRRALAGRRAREIQRVERAALGE